MTSLVTSSLIIFLCILSVECLDHLDIFSNINEKLNPHRVISLSNSDFKHGTVIIKDSNVRIELTEDIIFNPRSDYNKYPNEEGAYTCTAKEADLFPGCDKQPGSFRLGFFSALSLEADNIILDLKGYTLSVHPEFHLQQRFGTLISVGKGPFINGDGPSTFGEDISVKNIVIMNGHLGLTPHHGIHGNFITNIEIHDLTIKDFEVGGIQLNGFNDAYIHDVDIGPNLRNVPVRGKYSQARFGLLSYREMLKRLKKLSVEELEQYYTIEFSDRPGESMTAVEIIERLIKGMNLYFNYKINGDIPKLSTSNYDLFEESINLFDNEFGDPDGSALYGIILNSAGSSVFWFGNSLTDYSEDITIENVNIHDLNLRVEEIVTYVTESGALAIGPFAGALDLDLLLNLDEHDVETFNLLTNSVSNYNGNILSDAQIALALFGEGETERERISLDTEITGWAQGNNGLGKGSLICNGDDMFHMDKGVIGIRIDRTDYIDISNVNIRNINNWSELGSKLCNIPKLNNSDPSLFVSHPATPTNVNEVSNFKYQGRVSRGIALTDVSGDVSFNNIVIDGIVSAKGSSIGIDLLGSTEYEVNLEKNIIISNILSSNSVTEDGKEYLLNSESFPNNNIISCSMMSQSDLITFNEKNGVDLSVNNVDGPFVCEKNQE